MLNRSETAEVLAQLAQWLPGAKAILNNSGLIEGDVADITVALLAAQMASMHLTGVSDAMILRIARSAVSKWLGKRAAIGQKFVPGLHDNLDTAILEANVRETRKALREFFKRWLTRFAEDNADFLSDVTDLEPPF